MERVNIKEYKKEIRDRMRQFRDNLPEIEKHQKDRNVINNILKLNVYKNAKIILCYMSTPKEIETRDFIEKAWGDGKKVALPKCVNNPIKDINNFREKALSNQIDFYFVNSFSELTKQSFGLMEPNIDICEKVTDFNESICIIPAFCFDRFGYRIGYGGGYYDRFLHRYNGAKVGVIYKECIFKRLKRGRYDIPTNFIVTDLYIRTIKRNKL